MKYHLGLAVVIACALLGCSDQDSLVSNSKNTVVDSQQAIINGVLDTSEAHNAVVSIFYRYGMAVKSVCTGTLIDPHWVLTASHCVQEDDGETLLTEVPYYEAGFGGTPEQFQDNAYEIDGVYPHEDFGSPIWSLWHLDPSEYPDTPDSDIALLHLKEAVPEAVAKPILPLPRQLGLTRAAIEEGVTVEFVGFGLNEHNESGIKRTITESLASYCGAADGDTGLYCEYNRDEFPFGSIYHIHRYGGTCNGDSGGPAFVQIDGVEYVAGITSYGDWGCYGISVSTAVQDYYEWILSYIPDLEKAYSYDESSTAEGQTPDIED